MFKNRIRCMHKGEVLSRKSISLPIARDYEILKDEVTGVLYCAIIGGGSGYIAFTPLLDTDGKPLVDKSE